MLLDPHHEVEHVQVQLDNHNGGFVKDFARAFKDDATDEKKQFIIGFHPLDFPLYDAFLAKEYTVCDHWFSSSPPRPEILLQLLLHSPGTSNGGGHA